jgi:hypothetical protein
VKLNGQPDVHAIGPALQGDDCHLALEVGRPSAEEDPVLAAVDSRTMCSFEPAELRPELVLSVLVQVLVPGESDLLALGI